MPDSGVRIGWTDRMAPAVRNLARRRLHHNLTPARRTLLQHLPTGAIGAEVGVWQGDFTAQLLRRCRPRVLHLVDPWAFHPELPSSLYGGLSAHSQEAMDAVHAEVLARFERQIDSGQVVVHRAPSSEALHELGDSSMDWIYIDGDHRYDGVRADLAAGLIKVRPGGLLALDDYGVPGWWENGVQVAVDEFVEHHDVETLHRFEDQIVLRVARS